MFTVSPWVDVEGRGAPKMAWVGILVDVVAARVSRHEGLSDTDGGPLGR